MDRDQDFVCYKVYYGPYIVIRLYKERKYFQCQIIFFTRSSINTSIHDSMLSLFTMVLVYGFTLSVTVRNSPDEYKRTGWVLV